jgi:hypothetical protein
MRPTVRMSLLQDIHYYLKRPTLKSLLMKAATQREKQQFLVAVKSIIKHYANC